MERACERARPKPTRSRIAGSLARHGVLDAECSRVQHRGLRRGSSRRVVRRSRGGAHVARAPVRDDAVGRPRAGSFACSFAVRGASSSPSRRADARAAASRVARSRGRGHGVPGVATSGDARRTMQGRPRVHVRPEQVHVRLPHPLQRRPHAGQRRQLPRLDLQGATDRRLPRGAASRRRTMHRQPLVSLRRLRRKERVVRGRRVAHEVDEPASRRAPRPGPGPRLRHHPIRSRSSRGVPTSSKR